MSNIFCPCSGGGKQNTGVNAKSIVPKVAKKMFFVPMLANDGTRNEIANTDTIDAAYLTAKLNASDSSKRWYPTGTWVNVDRPTPDDITESFNDGSSSITGQNPKTFTGFLLNTPYSYIQVLENLACDRIGVYFIDACGSPVGEKDSTGTKLYPVEINRSSLSFKPVEATDTTTFKLQLTFEIKQSVKDQRMAMVKESALGDADFLGAEGLLDVDASDATAITTTGFTTSLSVDCGGFIESTAVEGFVLADFDLYNVTQDAAIVITSVTESPAGTYVFVIPAQTSADVLRLTSATSGDAFVKEGFEIVALDITIP